MRNKKTLRLAYTSLLCALAIAISAVEQLFPSVSFLPPGVKPGFSNIVTMATASALGPVATFSVVIVKALFVGMTRGVTAMLMSLLGGLFSAAVTVLLIKRNIFGSVGIGVLGAAVHSLTQLAVASLLLSVSLVFYLPWLLFFSIPTGILTGSLFGILTPFLTRISSRFLSEF